MSGLLSREEQVEVITGPHRAHFEAVARRHTTSQEDADDAMQQALMELWRKQPSFAAPANVCAWFTVVLRHRAWRLYRVAARHPETSLEVLSGSVLRDPVDPHDVVVRQERLDDVRRLKRPWASVLYALGAGFEPAEIEGMFGLTSRQVRRYREKGRSALAKAAP